MGKHAAVNQAYTKVIPTDAFFEELKMTHMKNKREKAVLRISVAEQIAKKIDRHRL